MLLSRVTTHLRRRAELLLSDQIDLLATTYAYPLPVFLEERRLLIGGAPQARQVLGRLRDSLAERGIVDLRPRITAIDLPRGGRFRVWVDWMEIAVPATGSNLSSAIYYCRDTADGIVTEMVSYTRSATPELNRQIEELALSA
jgi:hypothetical protein